MPAPALHRFTRDGRHFALDPETCFCFECDGVSRAVLEHYPHTPTRAIVQALAGAYPEQEILEVVGELEWLRGAKSILQPPTAEALKKCYAVETDLHTVVASWPGDLAAATQLLLGRAGQRREQVLEVRAPAGAPADPQLAEALAMAREAAALAGRRLTVRLRWPAGPLRDGAALAPHTLDWRLILAGQAALPETLQACSPRGASLSAHAEAAAATPKGATLEAILAPAHADFQTALACLQEAGLPRMALDLLPLYTTDPGADVPALFATLRAAVDRYADDLACQRYYRLDPFATWFWRVYQGEPNPRTDPSGTHALAIAADGGIYPSAPWFGQAAHRLGQLSPAALDEAARKRYEDIGALTTPACLGCWARHLCGGGTAAIHQAQSGDFRRPHPGWCDAQRDFLEHTIAAFNRLNAAGVNFQRVYQALGRTARPSLFQLARAAFRTQLGVRPIQEGDAPLLTKWEDWNPAAYFTLQESSMLLATGYDREMDALYPRAYEHELMVLHRDGTPLGLLRVRPERIPGLARLCVYFHDTQAYAERGIQRAFRDLLPEAAGPHGIRTVLTPVGPHEAALAQFLAGAGFREAGTERGALFLHGRYEDVRLFALSLSG